MGRNQANIRIVACDFMVNNNSVGVVSGMTSILNQIMIDRTPDCHTAAIPLLQLRPESAYDAREVRNKTRHVWCIFSVLQAMFWTA